MALRARVTTVDGSRWLRDADRSAAHQGTVDRGSLRTQIARHGLGCDSIPEPIKSRLRSFPWSFHQQLDIRSRVEPCNNLLVLSRFIKGAMDRDVLDVATAQVVHGGVGWKRGLLLQQLFVGRRQPATLSVDQF